MDGKGRYQTDDQSTSINNQSVVISTILDKAGLSTEKVAINILHNVALRNITDASARIHGANRPIGCGIHCGSQAEGISYSYDDYPRVASSLCSDCDILSVYHSLPRLTPTPGGVSKPALVPVMIHDRIMDVKQGTRSIIHWLAVTSPYNPGFVDLYYTDVHTVQPTHTVSSSEFNEDWLRSGNMVFSNRLSKPGYDEYQNMKGDMHGPAIQITWTDGDFTDIASCFHMSMWPTVASEWTTRPRPFGWPSHHLVEAVVNRGCHLVPIGHPNSPNYRSEWRLSFSVTERTLVWSFNDAQRKCYFILKILNKEVISSDAISSYHLKTLMFWMIEETDRRQWITENLLSNVRLCIHRLRLWIARRNVPSYFIPANNLIEHKITVEIQKQLFTVLDTMLHDLWGCVKGCGLIAEVQLSMSFADAENLPHQKRDTEEDLTLHTYHTSVATMIHSLTISMQDCMCNAIPLPNTIAIQKSLLKALEKVWPRVVVKYTMSKIENNIGSIYHAMYIRSCGLGKENDELKNIAEQIMAGDIDKLPACGLLKLCNFYYSVRQYKECMSTYNHFCRWWECILMDPDERINHLDALYKNMSSVQIASDLLECYGNVDTPKSRGWSFIVDEEYKQTKMDVIYTQSEIPCVDKPLVYEIVAKCFPRMYPGYVCIYPVTFATYLIFRMEYAIGVELEQSLHHWACLTQTLNTDRGRDKNSDRVTTSHNMLAYCLVLVGEYKDAARHVIMSLQISADLTNAALHYLLTALEFCQATAEVDAQNFRASCGPHKYVMLERMMRRLREAEKTAFSDPGKYADIVQGYIDDGCINELDPSILDNYTCYIDI